MKNLANNGFSIFFGDIHNHCGLSYGFGTIDDAIHNARLQLDFVSVTGHASWPDMPKDEERLLPVVEYHEAGFRRFEESWDSYLKSIEAANEPSRFVTFPSFEWHSMEDGDYVVYYRGTPAELFTARRIDELKEKAAGFGHDGSSVMMVPHHIGYHQGYRGINWQTFDESASPVVEIVSMHGCAESDEGALPYLHTMGPRVGANTMQGGLSAGKRFGVVGSTDHHNAHPGSYGHGRAAVWAKSLSRADIWEAFRARRTYAVSGDNIALAFSINGTPMGGEVDQVDRREISVQVQGGYAIEAVEVVKNGRLLSRSDMRLSRPAKSAADRSHRRVRGIVFVEVGWGETNVRQDWDVEIELVDAKITEVESKFRGVDLVDPNATRPAMSNDANPHRLSSWSRDGEQIVRFKTVTYGNATPSTDSTQALAVVVEGDDNSLARIRANGVAREYRIGELMDGSRSFYLGGFLSGAVHVRRFIPESEYTADVNLVDTRGSDTDVDYYYARIVQENGQWAWSSPIWVGDPV